MGIAKVTRNYQVTIPRDIRRVHDIKVGDTVLFAMEGEKVDFVKLDRENSIKSVTGLWKGKINERSIDYVKKIRGEWDERAKRVGL